MSGTLWWLILGLLIGWLIEWVIDWVYWRRPRETAAPVVETISAPQQPAREGPVLQQARAEVSRLEGELEQERARMQKMQNELESIRGQTSDLARIQGELQTANETLLERDAQLKQLQALRGDGDTSAQLRAELDTARALAAERQAEIDELRAQLAVTADAASSVAEEEAPTQPRIVLSEPEEDTRDRNFATVMLSRDDLAGHLPPDTDGQQPAGSAAEATLLEQQVAAPAVRDPLIDINGIGPVYEQKLFNAGIYTFAALADLSPEQIRSIVQPERWQNIEPEKWIAEARQRAGLSE